MSMQTIPEYLRSLQKEKKMSNAKLAKKMGVALPGLYKMLHNDQCINLKTYTKILKALGVEYKLYPTLTANDKKNIVDSPVFDTNKSATKELLKDIISDNLNPEESEILQSRLGLNGPHMTLEDVGKKFGITRECVRQKEEKAIKKLKTLVFITGTYNKLRDTAKYEPWIFITTDLLECCR